MGTEYQIAEDWFRSKDWKAFQFQKQAWKAYLKGEKGLVNAPTGSGKTYSLLLPILMEYINNHPDCLNEPIAKRPGLQAIWISPIRALTKEIELSAKRALEGIGLDWEVGIRTGDSSQKEKQAYLKKLPQILITTPESLHIMLAQKNYPKRFSELKSVVVDEWHELIGSKRGVQVELALSRLRGLKPELKTWGISATIGNLQEAAEIMLGPGIKDYQLIRSDIRKKIKVNTILPDKIESFPWAGHLGIHLLEKVIPIIRKSQSTLIFTNTRSQAEIWYQRILEVEPELAGQMAMHHGSISKDLRFWVEEALHDGRLKAVVCTSSLDLGVDFRPVETIIQIGGPKGVSRFLQRAGRSGHQPGASSQIHFVPTHSLEIAEGAALRYAIDEELIESRIPHIRSFDVLVQYLLTLAVGEGFNEKEIKFEINNTFSYQSISDNEWNWCLRYIHFGGDSLKAYDEFRRVDIENGLYKVNSRRVALRHRMSIGTIVSDTMMRVKMQRGAFLGSIEEYFVSRLKPGDCFWFAGQSLELINIKDMDVIVTRSKSGKGLVPSYQGGRMPLSSEMSKVLRLKLEEISLGEEKDKELKSLRPLIDIQRHRSAVPTQDQLLIEKFEDRDGHHVIVFPFEGRNVHEGMASLLAYRLSGFGPISFSIAMNDYGFELLSDQEIPIEAGIDSDIFSVTDLRNDIERSLNSNEMARRRFRDIASISGLVFSGYPGNQKKMKHLQSSSSLYFEVFREYEPENLLLIQSFQEAMDFQLEEQRLRMALERISKQEILIKYPKKASPFAFPILVDRLREKMSTESLSDRIKKMKLEVE